MCRAVDTLPRPAACVALPDAMIERFGKRCRDIVEFQLVLPRNTNAKSVVAEGTGSQRLALLKESVKESDPCTMSSRCLTTYSCTQAANSSSNFGHATLRADLVGFLIGSRNNLLA